MRRPQRGRRAGLAVAAPRRLMLHNTARSSSSKQSEAALVLGATGRKFFDADMRARSYPNEMAGFRDIDSLRCMIVFLVNIIMLRVSWPLIVLHDDTVHACTRTKAHAL